MLCLVYVSAAKNQTTDFDVGEILRQSRSNNAKYGISGMLLYSDGNFMQALEGEAAAVEQTFARIMRDERHSGLIELTRFEIAKRQFSEWSMAFRSPTDLTPQEQTELASSLRQWKTIPNTTDVSVKVRRLLQSFLQTM